MTDRNIYADALMSNL